MSGELLVRTTLEAAVVVALGGMLWAAVRRLAAGAVPVPRCPACGRPVSRVYAQCPSCRSDIASGDS